jgi:lysophospholipid acyltransferase (LPLAT)-like uncharacterized protein
MVTAEEGPLLFALWHQNLFAAGEIHRRLQRKKPICALISASHDGEWLAELFKRVDIGAVRGSSGHGACGAYAAARERVSSSCDLAITPDGPRGPRLHCKPGLIRLSQSAQAPIAAVRMRHGCARRLRSWDSFRLPLPFSKISVDILRVPPPAPLSTEEELVRFTESLEKILSEEPPPERGL